MLDHDPRDLTDTKKVPEQVDIDDLLPSREIKVVDRRGGADNAGVADEQIYPGDPIWFTGRK